MKIAVITLSDEGARLAGQLADGWSRGDSSADLFLHVGTTELPQARRFQRIIDLTQEVFHRYDGLVYIAPAGLVVRAIAPCIGHKTVDPGVVVVDVGGRWAVSQLGGHEGGANQLAVAVANILGAEPVISTTTEAVKPLIVGVGCRRGTSAETIAAAVHEALAEAGEDLSGVRLLASADIKADEAGLIEAARQLNLPLRLIPSDEIRNCCRNFEHSSFVEAKVDLPAVAEPAALLAGRRTQLLLPKRILHSVTVAIARENCTSLG